jgi:hypothetical protein
MTRPFSRLVPLAVVAAFAAACGATATLPPQLENPSLAGRVGEAVWYAEKGDHANLASASDGNSILVIPPGDESTYVNGAFTIDVPDRDSILFSAKVGLPSGTAGSVQFSAFVQDGTNFPKLADVPSTGDGRLNDFVIDLSRFRGRAVLLILAVSTPDQTPLTVPALWVDPRIITP